MPRTIQQRTRSPRFPTWIALRFLAYILVLIAIGSIPPFFAAQASGSGFFAERGPVEITQAALLLGMLILFLQFRHTMPQWKLLSTLLAACCLFAICRELDFLLDHWIPVVGWESAGIIPLVAAVYSYRKHSLFLAQLVPFLRTRAFGLLWAGLVITIVIAQLIGTSDLFQAMMGNDYVRHYKRVIEESIELLGYAMLLCGCIEYGFCCNEH